jgi:hypothetical protein
MNFTFLLFFVDDINLNLIWFGLYVTSERKKNDLQSFVEYFLL